MLYTMCSSFCRFDFLQSWHQYNTYYEFKKNYFMQKEGKGSLEVLWASYVCNHDSKIKRNVIMFQIDLLQFTLNISVHILTLLGKTDQYNHHISSANGAATVSSQLLQDPINDKKNCDLKRIHGCHEYESRGVLRSRLSKFAKRKGQRNQACISQTKIIIINYYNHN